MAKQYILVVSSWICLQIFNWASPHPTHSDLFIFAGESSNPNRNRNSVKQNSCRILSATAVLNAFHPQEKEVRGMVLFHAIPNSRNLQVTFNITGMRPNSIHGCHIHQRGTLTNNCDNLGPHVNPNNVNHGTPNRHDLPRHVGDLIDNIIADQDGSAIFTYDLEQTKDLEAPTLCGDNSIIGRTIVLHEDPDDGGLTMALTSSVNGNAGARIACGVIGINVDHVTRRS